MTALDVVRRIAEAAAWLVLVVAIALGGAGIVAGANHLPASGARPELTSEADASVAVGLEGAAADLAAVAAATGDLGAAGRGALSALVAADPAAVASSIAEGDAALDRIDVAEAALRDALRAIPLGAPDAEIRYSPATRERYDRLVSALSATTGLREDWGILTAGTVPALEIAAHLTGHDALAGEAARLGSEGRYADALAKLSEAAAELAAAQPVRDRLAASVDVATLDAWIARNAAIDAALRDLYTLLEASSGRGTPAVLDAFTRVEEARKLLPPDTRALVVILADIARGGLNQAVISIEQARGRLTAAAGTVQ